MILELLWCWNLKMWLFDLIYMCTLCQWTSLWMYTIICEHKWMCVHNWYFDWMNDVYEYMWKQYVMRCVYVAKILREPNPCEIGISNKLKKWTMCILSLNHESCCACVLKWRMFLNLTGRSWMSLRMTLTSRVQQLEILFKIILFTWVGVSLWG